MKTQRAFTLLELLVVVGILALVSSSALLILDHEDDQRRYERTRDEYEEIHAAIFGPPPNLSGQSVVSGFLSDTGRLPRNLDELMNRPVDMPPWRPILADAQSYHQLGGRLYHGWRGPYLGRTRANLEDAWGNPWVYEPPDSRTGAPLRFGSLGRNGLPGGADLYDRGFPDVLDIEGSFYSEGLVPIPSITVGYDREGKDEEFGPFLLGVIHAGLDLNERFVRQVGVRRELHPSLARDPERASAADGGGFLIRPRGFEVKDRGKPKERKQFKEKEQEFLPQNLYLFAAEGGPHVRQFQLAAYRIPSTNQGSATLRQMLVSINPEIYSTQPRASVAYEKPPRKDWVHWLIPDR
jgi:prepilin-type N-terminal cleavage/methylation domain-containing protein